jgi:hypothetical protein
MVNFSTGAHLTVGGLPPSDEGGLLDVGLCLGVSTDHCCYVAGVTCRFLRDDGPTRSRRWVCTLREKLGSWKAVHADPGYLEHVRPAWSRTPGVTDCGDFPLKGEACAECGVVG